jgi:hypothetical protein
MSRENRLWGTERIRGEFLTRDRRKQTLQPAPPPAGSGSLTASTTRTSADIEAWHAFSPGIRPVRRRNDAAVTFG